jgi:hypothetical protein
VGREADRSPPSRAKVKNNGDIIPQGQFYHHFTISIVSRMDLEPTQPSTVHVPGFLSAGVKSCIAHH